MSNVINTIQKLFSDSKSKEVYKPITVVNENDEVLAYLDLFEAIRQGHIRRVVRIFVFNESGQILIQRRGSKVLSPLKLDQSAAGHVDEGDTYESAAVRELEEELGISGYALTLVRPPFRTRHFFNAAYKLTVPDNIVIKINPEEVENVEWYEYSTFVEMIANSPQEFTASFVEAWPFIHDKIQVP